MAYLNPIPDLEDELEMPKVESESDYVQMNEVYFAFIDVLGFKKTFDDIKISKEPDTADKYRDVLRGFYIDMEKELPGPLVYSTKEVIDQIKHLDEMNQKYAQRYEVFYDKFCSIDDGNASQRAVEAVFK